ncbi:hypothetical protein Rsub_01762 [Raphidocelis subcapitata]|uniref:DUF952 domain-containing protein n=1 Tax=Raphidocelis subcapitata TaxID=307507 RepID=A0A2V0NW54_9CHLO|nr:hypothetical protein Rsub_01762 [Raphidocelis subcapitata]|eukprot:GBF89045.1 hypothetical protein Rsub_01762 [Raphidocelis subcapitata]
MAALYHLVQQSLWEATKAAGAPYKPPTYDADGFTHLTQDPALLLGVANHFYAAIAGPFLVLEIDPARLPDKVVFEPAAPVGTTPAVHADAVLFPHLYGPIPAAAVVRELAVERGGDGAFLSIQGLPQARLLAG